MVVNPECCHLKKQATSNPTENDDVTKGFGIGSEWINTATGALYKCFDATEGAAVWTAMGGTGFQPQIIDGGGHSYSGTAYTAAKKVPFLGTTKLGTPTKIKVIGRVDAGATWSCRIYDATNAQVIATKTGMNNTTDAIQDLGTLSNIPASEAVWEVQIKVDGAGPYNAYIYGGTIE